MTYRAFWTLPMAFVFLAGCGGDPAAPADASGSDSAAADSSVADSAVPPDGTTEMDASMLPDAASEDAASADATVADASLPRDSGECVRPELDPTAPGRMCEDPLGTPAPEMCPTGYGCIEFIGFRLGYTCERACTKDCDCPQGTECGMRCDKSGCIAACVAT